MSETPWKAPRSAPAAARKTTISEHHTLEQLIMQALEHAGSANPWLAAQGRFHSRVTASFYEWMNEEVARAEARDGDVAEMVYMASRGLGGLAANVVVHFLTGDSGRKLFEEQFNRAFNEAINEMGKHRGQEGSSRPSPASC